jgi:membrane-bound lytic murein transglycosylase B
MGNRINILPAGLLVLSLTFGSIAFLPARPVFAVVDCLTISANASADQKAYCQNQINELEAQLKVLNDQLAKQKGQSGTLQGDINVLNAKIKAKQTEITSKTLKLSQLNRSITEQQKAIVTLTDKINREKDALAKLLRKTNEMDSVTLTSFLVSSKSLSHFYSDVSRYDALKSEIKSSVDTISQIKGVTIQKKAQLEKEQDATIDEKASLEVIKKTIEKDQSTQKTLLSISKNKEAEYQKVIAAQQAKVAQIKARLFNLAGGAQAIRFDIALQYAEMAAAKTGVDPAFVLAILTQESSLGKNVGQCYLTDTVKGSGVGANTGRAFVNVMKPDRDVQPFIEITTRLGFDWQKTLISCPIAGVAGYGGAMGPAQFIASTWKMFETRLRNTLGREANPWNAEDAFLASAMYLTDLGAKGASTANQLRAACSYYGTRGATCAYGRSVQTLKNAIQADIDYLKEYGVSRR